MGKIESIDQMISNEISHKRNSNESDDHMKKTNSLSVNERDYMIQTSMRRLGVDQRWKPVVARAANYISGARFWEIAEYSAKANSKARCFIKCLNNEMYH